MKYTAGIRRTLGMLMAGMLVLASGCDSRVYVRDGVTDGSRFSLPDYVNHDSDPVLQSWVAYNLTLSVCQLEMGGDNPARNHSFDCERVARGALVERWDELGGEPVVSEEPIVQTPDAAYLDSLRETARADLLDEYVWVYLKRRRWMKPTDLDVPAFKRWRTTQWPDGHRAQTRIIGSWGYPPD